MKERVNQDDALIVQKVSTNWLRDHLKDESIQLIDVQPNVHDYIKEHIPTAVYLNGSTLRLTKNGMPATFASEEKLRSIFRQLGIKSNKIVVIYSGRGSFKGWGDGLEAFMVSYILARSGHDKIFILDGGIDKWKSEQKPLSQVFPKIKSSHIKVNTRKQFVVTIDEVKRLEEKDDVLLLDARPTSFYQGTSGPWIRNGHIPGAINLPWKLFVDETNPYLLKPDHIIQSILNKYHISKDKRIICSCGTGREATIEFVILNWFLNYPNVRLYEGSFTEWSADPSNPVESVDSSSIQQRIM